MKTYARIVGEWARSAFEANRPLTTAVVFATLALAVAPSLVSLFISEVVERSSQRVLPTMPLIGLVATVLLWLGLARLLPLMSETLRDDLARHIRKQLMRFSGEIPTLHHLEQPKLVDRVHLLDRDAYRLAGVQNLLTALSAIASSVLVCTLLASLSPLYVLLFAVALLPSVASTVADFRQGQIWLGNEPWRRVADAASDVLLDAKYGVIVRSYGLATPLRALIARSQDRQGRLRASVRVRFGLLELGGAVIFTGTFLVALHSSVSSLRDGDSTAGDLTLLLLLIPQIIASARSIAGSGSAIIDGAQTFRQYLLLKDYASDATRRAELSPPDSLRIGIELRNLQFTHDRASGAPAIDGLNLRLPAGSVVCLIGANGAGKSTLVKLLAGLYQPTHGTVEVDQQPLKDVDASQWFARVSAGFQDFARFEFSLSDSVTMGNRSIGRAEIDEALTHAQADAMVDGLPDGLDTQLGVRFKNGSGLSGGQWQRVALARAFAKPEPLLVLLDEPASALDPESELALYRSFLKTSRRQGKAFGTVTIFVSHRLATAQLADRIIVLDNGRISEMGTHTELIRAGGEYARLFELQTNQYRSP